MILDLLSDPIDFFVWMLHYAPSVKQPSKLIRHSTIHTIIRCYISPFLFFILMIFAGTPATTALSGTGLFTTAFAPIVTLLPMVIPPNTIAPLLIRTLFPIFGNPGYLELPPHSNLLSYRTIRANRRFGMDDYPHPSIPESSAFADTCLIWNLAVIYQKNKQRYQLGNNWYVVQITPT